MEEVYYFITQQELDAWITRYWEKIINWKVNWYKIMVTQEMPTEHKPEQHPFKKFI